MLFNQIGDVIDVLYRDSCDIGGEGGGDGTAAYALGEMRRAVGNMQNALYDYQRAWYGFCEELRRKFTTYGALTYDDADKASSEFDAMGFESEKARAFAMAVRGMFLDDGQEWSRRVKCVGVSKRVMSCYVQFRVTFEDSGSGRQFQIGVPFTFAEGSEKTDEPAGRDPALYGEAFDYPCYALYVSGRNGDKITDVRSIVPKPVRDAVAGYVQKNAPSDVLFRRNIGCYDWYEYM